MTIITIRQGHDLDMAGRAEKIIFPQDIPQQAALQPCEIPDVKSRLLVEEGQSVNTGTALFEDKRNPALKFLAPVTGIVTSVNRGERRALQEIIIDSTADNFENFGSGKHPESMNRDEVVELLFQGGCWPLIRRRPYNVIPDMQEQPKSIFINGMCTAPLGLDPVVALKGRAEEFQWGVEVLRKLTQGNVHLCMPANCQLPAFVNAKGVVQHQFRGPHPAGNTGVHIHHIDPIKDSHESVWTLKAQDVLILGTLFRETKYLPERIIAVAGEGVKLRRYVKTRIGASIKDLTAGQVGEGELRYISGTVMGGSSKRTEGYLGFYDDTLTILPEGRKRHFLGWLMPGFKKYTLSRTFASAMHPPSKYKFNTSFNGENRAIVLSDIYDRYVPLNVMTTFLVKACLAKEIELMEKLGIFECDEEDFAVATFMCPSKTDISGIIKDGLNQMQAEG